MNQSTLFGPPFEEVAREFRETLDEGGLCPCCGRFCKRYKRKLNSGMARALVWLWQRNRGEWFNMESELRALIATHPDSPRSGDPAKLRYWDLLRVADKENRAAPGSYQITPKGKKFALGWIRVPRHVLVYNDRREGFSDDSTDIREALGDAFDWDDLMKEVSR